MLFVAFAIAAPAAAQQAAPPADDADIVVTGEREEAIRAFVGALTQVPQTGQIPRFEDSICPAAYGLAGPVRDAVVARMRAVANAVGLRTGDARCRPNVLLMVTADKKRAHSCADSAQSGLSEAVLNADGRGLRMVGGVMVNQTTRQASRIEAAARPSFVAAAVVIEQDALVGPSTTRLADYTLMRALARTDPAQIPASAPATILRVVDAPADSEVPITLTQWDLAFCAGSTPARRTRAPRPIAARSAAPWRASCIRRRRPATDRLRVSRFSAVSRRSA